MAKLVDIVLRMVDRVSPSTNQIARNASKAADALDVYGKAAGAAAATLGVLAASKALDFVDESVREFARAEESLRRLETVAKSTSGVLGGELNQAFRQAQDFATKHRFAVQEVIDTYFQFGTAGFNLAESVNLGTQALFLANAVMLDTTTSAQLLATIMNSLGQTTSLAFESINKAGTRAASALATSIQLFAVTGQQLQAGLKFAIGSASLLGIEIEDLVTTLGSLNTAGLKGSVAGTALNQAFIQMNKAVVKLGLNLSNFVDETGKFTNVADLLSEVQRTVGNLGPFERFNTIIEGFGIRGARAISALLPFAPTLNAIQQRMKANGDQAQRLSEIFENNLNTAFERTANAVKVAQQNLGQALAPTVLTLLEVVGRLARGLGVLVDGLGGLGTTAAVALLSVGALVAGVYALVAAFNVATGAAVAFGAVLSAVLPPFLILVGLIGGFIALLFALGAFESQADAARQRIEELDKVQFKGIQDQVAEAVNALNTLEKATSDVQKTAAQGTLNDLNATPFGTALEEATRNGRALQLTTKQIADNFKRATDVVLSADPLADFGLAGINSTQLDQVRQFIATVREVQQLSARRQQVISVRGDQVREVQQVIGSVDDFRAALQRLNDQFGEGIIDSGKDLNRFATIMGVGVDRAREIAEAIDDLSDLAIDDDFFDLVDNRFADALDNFRELPLVLRAANLAGALKPAEQAALSIATAFNSITRSADLAQNVSTITGNLETLQKAAEESANVNIGENLAAQFEFAQDALQALLERQDELEAGRNALADIVGGEAFKGFDAAVQTGLREQLRAATADIADNLRLTEAFREEAQSLSKAIEQNLAPIGDTVLREVIRDGMTAGLAEGADQGRAAMANSIIEGVRGSIITGAASGFASISAAQLTPFLNTVQDLSQKFFSDLQAGDGIQAALSRFSGSIDTSGLDLTGLNKFIEGGRVLEEFIFGKLIPTLGPELGGAMQEALAPIDEAANKVAELRAQLLTTRAGPDQSVLNQIINARRGEGSFFGVDAATASAGQLRTTIEGVINNLTTAGGELAISQGTLNSLIGLYKELAAETEVIRDRSDISGALEASRAGLDQTRTSMEGLGSGLNTVKSAAQELKEAFITMPEAVAGAVTSVRELKAEVTGIAGQAAVSVGTNGNDIDIQIGDFNLTIDGDGGGVTEEDIERALTETGLKIEEAKQEVLDRLAEVLRNR